MRKVIVGAIFIALFAPATAWAAHASTLSGAPETAHASIMGGAPETDPHGDVPLASSSGGILTVCSGFTVSPHVVLTARHCGNLQAAGWGGSGDVSTYYFGGVRRIVHAPWGADLEAVWTRHAYGWRYRIRLSRPYVGQLLFMDGFGLTNPSDPNSWGSLNYATGVAHNCPLGWDVFCVHPSGYSTGGVAEEGDSGGPVYDGQARAVGIIDKTDSYYTTVVLSLFPFRAWVLAQERAAG
jgi:hypothetical protein